VASEDVRSVATEAMPSVATEDISTVPTQGHGRQPWSRICSAGDDVIFKTNIDVGELVINIICFMFLKGMNFTCLRWNSTTHQRIHNNIPHHLACRTAPPPHFIDPNDEKNALSETPK